MGRALGQISSNPKRMRRDAFIKVFTSMPNVGVDSDFQQVDLIEVFPHRFD